MRLEELVEGLPETRRLYLYDSYLTEFKSAVLRAEFEGRDAYVVLDATAFHPKGGGQPSDTGIIRCFGEVHVKKAMFFGGVIVHWGKATGALHGEAIGAIDWGPRYLYMRRHTGGHLLDHCLTEAIGMPVETSDSWLGEGCYVSYVGEAPPYRVVEEAVDSGNEAILRGRAVNAYEASLDELMRLAPTAPNIRRLPRLKRYRVVEIDGCGPIPCGGTHVRNIREIGRILLRDVRQLSGEYRIYYDVEEATV
jgi:Ser-tRNA(Ala) deacylase AlaX